MASLQLAIHACYLELMFLARLLGMMVLCHDIVAWAQFHSRPLQTFLRPFQKCIERRKHLVLPFPQEQRLALLWWTQEGRLSKDSPLGYPPRLVVMTDASLSGWGGHMTGAVAQGVWSTQESKLHINILELRAIRLTLIHFARFLQEAHVMIRTDNVTAKAFINRQGGTRSTALSREASLLIWTEENFQSIVAEHLAGLDNAQADWLSRRQLKETEWQLNPQVFREIVSRFRLPEVDLFTSHPNVQRFLRGVAQINPPPIHRFPSWDLSKILKVLTGNPFEPLATCLWHSWRSYSVSLGIK